MVLFNLLLIYQNKAEKDRNIKLKKTETATSDMMLFDVTLQALGRAEGLPGLGLAEGHRLARRDK